MVKVDHLSPEVRAQMMFALRRVTEQQYRTRAQPGAPVIWQGTTLWNALPMVGRSVYSEVDVCVTADGMFYCATQPTTERGQQLLFCLSVLAPNRVQMRRGSFWVTTVDGREDEVRFGSYRPMTVSFLNPREAAVPYFGAVAMIRGRRRAKPLKIALRSLGVPVG